MTNFLAVQRIHDDMHYLTEARIEATLSTCLRKKVGACLNNPAIGLSECARNKEKDGLRCDGGECPRGQKSADEKAPNEPPYDDCVAVHAEAAVLARYKPGSRLYGLTLYVTHEPCPECLEVIERYPGLRVVVMVVREFIIGNEGQGNAQAH